MLEAQIKAIKKNIAEGKVKNIYAARNKIKTLQKQLDEMKQQSSWNKFLSQ